MGHENHNHTISSSEGINKAFIWGIALNIGFVALEAGAGLYLNSMALLSDAGHNLSDVISLALALVAMRISILPANKQYTYGYKKSSILASLINAILLVVAVIFIIIESIKKIEHPEPINGGLVAWIAGIGIIINGVTTLLFLKYKSHDINIKGAFLHMFADTLVSVGVLVAGIVIRYTDFYIIDSIIGIVIGIIILFSTWNLLSQSLRLTLDGVPLGINLGEISNKISSISGVKNVHHVHLWAISTTENAITAHIVTDLAQDKIPELKSEIKDMLFHNNIPHATLEFENLDEKCEDIDCK